MIIGICGKSGSGKSTLAKEIANKHDNSIYVDIDEIGHEVLDITEVKEELVRCFGESVVSYNVVDRRILGDIVFNSRMEMDKLTNITWKYMKQRIDEILMINRGKVVILEWILLPITEYFGTCDITVLLDVPYQVRMKRAMARDLITEEAFILRESASIDLGNFDFDYVIKDNSEEFVKELVKLL